MEKLCISVNRAGIGVSALATTPNSMRLIIDTESDNLAYAATTIHCIVAKDIDIGKIYKFYGSANVTGDHGAISTGIDFISQANVLIGHNILEHDLPLLGRLGGLVYAGQTVDTLVISRALNPDRHHPPGCPGSNLNPVTGRSDRIGPHSIAAWGYRVGKKKVDIYDWRVFTPGMLCRCIEDVEINHLVFSALLKELEELKR